jgi:DNA uptake protein ComE-like DNA-binding protein
MVFFSVLCAGLYGIISSQIRLVKRVEDGVICEYLAKAATAYAAQEKAKDKTDYDTLYELSAKRERELGYGKFSYSIVDEEGKININKASIEIIEKLPGFNAELAVLATDADTRPFHAKEELLLVEGVTDAIFEKCKNFITVYSDGKVNINTAPLETLLALGLDEQTAAMIVDFRSGADLEEATEDDEVFEDTGKIIDKLRGFRGLSEAQEASLLALISQGALTTESKNFSLNIETQVLDKPSMKYSIIMGEGSITQWQEW